MITIYGKPATKKTLLEKINEYENRIKAREKKGFEHDPTSKELREVIEIMKRELYGN